MDELKYWTGSSSNRVFHNITLPTANTVKFPDKCAQCGMYCNTSYKVSSIWTVYYDWRIIGLFFFPGLCDYQIKVPAHKSCARKLHLKHFLTVLSLWMFVILIISVTFWTLGSHETIDLETINLIALSRFALPVIPVLLLLVLNSRIPENFWFTFDDDTICYYFRDKAYAEEFAKLNGGAIDIPGTTHDPYTDA